MTITLWYQALPSDFWVNRRAWMLGMVLMTQADVVPLFEPSLEEDCDTLRCCEGIFHL